MHAKRCLMTMVCFLVGLLHLPAHGDGEWKKVMDKDGIQSFSRVVPGSNILEFRAVVVIHAPIEVVGEVVRDITSYPDWVPYYARGEILDMEDRNNMIVYVHLDFPWPVSDRDIVARAQTTYDLVHGRAVTKIENVETSSRPPVTGVVRLPEFRGVYVFEYIAGELTGVIYTYRADVGGKLPVSLVNAFSRFNMFRTFENLRRMADLPRFREMGEASPDRDVVRSVLDDPETHKAAVVARLREFVGSEPFLGLLADYPGLAELMADNDGQASRDLLYGWGAPAGKKDAVKSVLSAYIRRTTGDEDRVNAALADQDLIDAILTGAPEEFCVLAVIERHREGR